MLFNKRLNKISVSVIFYLKMYNLFNKLTIMANYFQNGLVQIYTGAGKGKTTAALGLALRASGYGIKTYIGQFLKGQSYGELTALENNPYIQIEQYGKDTFVHVNKATAEDIASAENGLQRAKEAIFSGKYAMVILDEVFVAIHFRLLSIQQVMEFINEKPQQVELVLTGRRAPKELIDRADLVTEMREIKHYYQAGISARTGIER